MKSYRVGPSSLKGSVLIPSSKSHTMRAILFGAMASGKSVIRRYLPAPDTNHMIRACELLGAKITNNAESLEIEGVDGKVGAVEDVIQAGNSGIILRFIPGIAALSPSYVVITGDHSLRHQRPMKIMLDGLNQLSVFAISSREDGYAPLIIKGPLKGGKATLPGRDSQPVSSLLIACALAEGPTELTIKDPGEKPWINLTLDWFDRLGIPYENENFEKYRLEGKARYQGFEYTVPGDWSSAAFPIAAALVTNSSLTLENIDMNDPQGDKGIVNALIEMGAQIEIDDDAKTLQVKAGSKLKGTTIDINPFIDAITTLAVIACFAEGKTQIINASVAREKECDRIHCITEELKKMGADITEEKSGLTIKGSPLKGASVQSYHDHRMAMSLAIAAMGAKGASTINDVECIAKTFPNFVETFQSLDAQVELVEK